MTRNATKPAVKKAVKNLGDRLIESLTELRDTLRSGIPLERKFTVRTVEVPDPEKFDAQRVRALRKGLQMSQFIFARLLGVSTILVQSWEQAVREPSPLARRLLAEIERDPRRWQRMIVAVSPGDSSRKRKSA